MKRRAIFLSFMLSAIVALATASLGCTNPLVPAPSVTETAPYVPPSPTPTPAPTVAPTPTPTSWNGDIVKLYGNVTVIGGEHVYGTIKVSYMDKNYWDEYPTVRYDTNDDGGAYSLDVMANVPFRVTLGYTYIDKLSPMNTKIFDDIITLHNDTRRDFTIMASNATQVK
jgi:hypothetical protein